MSAEATTVMCHVNPDPYVDPSGKHSFQDDSKKSRTCLMLLHADVVTWLGVGNGYPVNEYRFKYVIGTV
jgi:hypothetical protein